MIADRIEAEPDASLHLARAESQYLCFWLGGQSYALPVLAVEEIRAAGACCALPGQPPWLLGLMNLRGRVIPVMDLRLRFGLRAGAGDSPPVMIVVSSGGRLTGLVVDGVNQVLRIDPGSHSVPRPPGGEPGPGQGGPVADVSPVGGELIVRLDPAALWENREGLMHNVGLVQ